MVTLVIGLVVTIAVSLLFTPLVRRIAHRRKWFDLPDEERKIHTEITPHVGGLAIVAAFLIGVGFFYVTKGWGPDIFTTPSLYVLGGGLFIAGVGFYDDLYGIHFSHKFVLQVLVACFVVYGGYRVDIHALPWLHIDQGAALLLSFPITVIWIVGIINAINLLDGMDGLAAGVAVIAFGSLSAAYAVQGDLDSLVLSVSVVGALIGFLFYNSSPASIFMGDSGSMFIGFLLAVFSLRGSGHVDPLLALLIPVIAMGLPVMDTGLAIVRRFLERRPLFSPDRDHIHHRIARRMGLDHRTTVLILYLVSVVLGVAAFLLAVSGNVEATLILCATGIGSYFFLRMLGYLRVRESLRLIWKHYLVRADDVLEEATNGHVPTPHDEATPTEQEVNVAP